VATEGNPGVTKATEAARAVGGLVAIPDFGSDRLEGVTDFNDMAEVCGLDAVKRAIASASAPARGEYQPGEDGAPAGYSEGNGWPVPHPLAAKVTPEPYPIDALPLPIRAAVEEVTGFVKAPVPMVASSALAALSLAIQAHADAKRAEKLHGPVGLFLLTIADSGERKSTCDGFFTKPIRDYEEAQAEAAKRILKDHNAAIEAWEAKRGGVKEKIRQLAKDNKPTAGMESALRDLEHDKPEPPRIPRLLYADATPEALAYGLAKQWPSGGVVSAEAGIVFGSHGMGKDSVMRNLGLLNQLWDGTSLTIDRRSTESFTVRGARLTVALQVQEPTLREFFTRSGALARGMGFLARFLVAWPESTQGQRPFTDPPANWPHLAAFHRRIAAILDQPVPIDEDGALTPPMLPLTPEAKAEWVEYHNAIESELSSGGELYDVRDVASKSADNAARLAALFQVFEGAGGAIGADAFEGASRITAWHLNEARRFFGELALPAELADAARLDSWLIEHCRQGRAHLVGKNHVRQHGPLRDGARLDAAIRELDELDRLRLVKDGKRLTIQVNPALVIEGRAS
jgi:putative DNA primase/helicase